MAYFTGHCIGWIFNYFHFRAADPRGYPIDNSCPLTSAEAQIRFHESTESCGRALRFNPHWEREVSAINRDITAQIPRVIVCDNMNGYIHNLQMEKVEALRGQEEKEQKNVHRPGFEHRSKATQCVRATPEPLIQKDDQWTSFSDPSTFSQPLTCDICVS